MCLIIDANRIAEVFAPSPTNDFRPIFDWLARDGLLVYGGKLASEFERCGRAASFLMELVRQGRAVRIPEAELARAMRTLPACRSNDAHVLALVCASGVRTVCTEDRTLWDDLKDRMIVPPPRVAIYRTARHTRLLNHTAQCPGARREREGKPRSPRSR